ncbi:hypothetical protein AAZX31_01G108200 [Glycine max]
MKLIIFSRFFKSCGALILRGLESSITLRMCLRRNCSCNKEFLNINLLFTEFCLKILIARRMVLWLEIGAIEFISSTPGNILNHSSFDMARSRCYSIALGVPLLLDHVMGSPP